MANFANNEFTFRPLNLFVYCIYYTDKNNFFVKKRSTFSPFQFQFQFHFNLPVGLGLFNCKRQGNRAKRKCTFSPVQFTSITLFI